MMTVSERYAAILDELRGLDAYQNRLMGEADAMQRLVEAGYGALSLDTPTVDTPDDVAHLLTVGGSPDTHR